MASTPGVVPYFDISFQHASGPAAAADAAVRRAARRSSTWSTAVRERVPQAGIRSNVIVGFPGETEADVAELEAFLVAARLDVVGVFGYSDEDGTEAETYDGEAARRRRGRAGSRASAALVEELNAQRAEERSRRDASQVLVEEIDARGRRLRCPAGPPHQGPDVDGVTLLPLAAGGRVPRVGDLVQRHGGGHGGHRPRCGACVTPSDGPADRPSRRRGHAAGPVSAWNIANALTVLRIALVPVFGVAAAVRRGHETRYRILGGRCLRAGQLTDRIDGDIARARGLVTDFGKVSDPIADKALMGTAFVGLSRAGRAAVVGDDRGAGPRGRDHGHAVRGDPSRGHAGQPRRQGQDGAAGVRDRVLVAAVSAAPGRGTWLSWTGRRRPGHDGRLRGPARTLRRPARGAGQRA